MHHFMQLLTSLSIVAGGSSRYFNVTYSWKQVEYEFPNDTIRDALIESNDYIPNNNMPLGLAVWCDKMFITVPRWKAGVLSTLNSFSMRDKSPSPVLKPYPDLETNYIHSPDGLVSILRVRIDSCDRMWGLDMGQSDILGDTKTVRPMRLIVIDLRTDQIIRKYTLKDTDQEPDSFIADLAVDVPEGQCDQAYAYMSDLTKYGLVVYSWAKNDSWRITHNFFHFDPINGNYNVDGRNFQWTDGIFGLSLSPEYCSEGNRTLYFHAMSGITEFSVSTDVLQDETQQESSNYHNFHIVGNKGPLTQGPSSVIDPKTCVDYFAQANRNGIACWNTETELTPETFKLVEQNNKTMLFPQDVVIDHTTRTLYTLANNLPKFMMGDFDSSETNFYVSSAKLDALTRACKSNRRSAKRNYMIFPGAF